MVYPGTMHKLMLLSVTLLVGIACSDDSSSAAVPEASCCSSSKDYTSTHRERRVLPVLHGRKR